MCATGSRYGVGVVGAYTSDGDYCMRTSRELRSDFGRIMQVANTKKVRDGMIANLLLNTLDGVLVDSWSYVSDMGVTRNEFVKIKNVVKRRL